MSNDDLESSESALEELRSIIQKLSPCPSPPYTHLKIQLIKLRQELAQAKTQFIKKKTVDEINLDFSIITAALEPMVDVLVDESASKHEKILAVMNFERVIQGIEILKEPKWKTWARRLTYVIVAATCTAVGLVAGAIIGGLIFSPAGGVGGIIGAVIGAIKGSLVAWTLTVAGFGALGLTTGISANFLFLRKRKNSIDDIIKSAKKLINTQIHYECINHKSNDGQTRKITVIDGQPYYQSSGQNSRSQGTWFPFVMLLGTEYGTRSQDLPDPLEKKYIRRLYCDHYPQGYFVKFGKATLQSKVPQLKTTIYEDRIPTKKTLITSSRLGGGTVYEDTVFIEAELSKKEIALAKTPLLLATPSKRIITDLDEVNQWLITQGATALTALKQAKASSDVTAHNNNTP